MRFSAVCISAVLLAAAPSVSAQTRPTERRVPDAPAETLYYNGKIITMWPEKPVVEAITVAQGRILAVGTTQEVGRTTGPRTRQIDLEGKTMLPGLIDSHVHPISAALAEKDGEIPVLGSFADLRAHVEKEIRSSPPDKLIFVPKVYSTRLLERRYPTRAEIDAYSQGRRVMFDNGYAAALNSAALAFAGISKSTPEPPDGKIIRDKSGEPAGLILGARRLLAKLLERRSYTEEDSLRALAAMQKAYNQVGITSVIDRAVNAARMRVYQRLWEQGSMTVRSYLTRTVDAERPIDEIRREIEALGPVTGFGDEYMRVGSLKIFLDGGILIGTAYLRSPYGEHTEVYGFDDPDYRGVLRVEPEKILAVVKLAARLGWQMTAHTTGGASTDALLDAYEAVDREQSISERRFTLTHANFPNDEAIRRAAKLGVVMDLQPAWYHFDGPALSRVLV